jgi:hypothetical protein
MGLQNQNRERRLRNSMWNRMHYRFSSLGFAVSPVSASPLLVRRSFATPAEDGIAGASERDAAAAGGGRGG